MLGGAQHQSGYRNLSILHPAADFNMSPFRRFIQHFGSRAMRQMQEYDSIDVNLLIGHADIAI